MWQNATQSLKTTKTSFPMCEQNWSALGSELRQAQKGSYYMISLVSGSKNKSVYMEVKQYNSGYHSIGRKGWRENLGYID